MKTLNSFIYIWQQQKKNLLNATNGNSEDSDNEYELWKSRFPMDIHNYWNNILNKIDNYYDPLVNSLYNTPKINTTDDFLTQIRELIQTGLEFEVYQDFCAKRGSCLTLTFMTSDILSPINKEIETLFAKFLFNLKTLEEYGMTIDRNILTFFRQHNSISFTAKYIG